MNDLYLEIKRVIYWLILRVDIEYVWIVKLRFMILLFDY